MSTPLISVIVPVYNAEDYLEECLNSIIHQTFTDIEIICVNDGSTDSSAKILEEYALRDSRITVLHQTNQRQGVARNAGLQFARGKYISFIDSDDFLDLKTYQELSQQLGKADLIAFAGKSFLTGNNVNILKHYKGAYDAPFVGRKDLTDNIKARMTVSVCMKIFKKEILDKYVIQFPAGLRYEDNAFTFKYLSVIKTIYYFEQTFYYRRIRVNSTMTNTFAKQSSAIDILHVCKDIYNFLIKYDLFEMNEHLFAEKLRNCFQFALRFSPQSERNTIYEVYENYISICLSSTVFGPMYLEELHQIKNTIFSPFKYYTYKWLFFITYGKTKERFRRNYQLQKQLRF